MDPTTTQSTTQSESQILFKNKRDQYIVEIRRKKNREEISQKRIKVMQRNENNENNTNSANAKPYRDPLGELEQEQWPVFISEVAHQIIQAKEQNNLTALCEACTVMREVTSAADRKPPVGLVIDTQVAPLLIELATQQYYKCTELIEEVSWILANLASGEKDHTEILINNDIVPTAINLLLYDNLDVKTNALWLLSNLAGDSVETRNLLIKFGVVDKMKKMIGGNTFKPEFLVDVAWLMSNLTRGKPSPDYSDVLPLLDIAQFFLKLSNKKILSHTLWTISQMSDGDEEQIQDILNLDVAEKLILLLGNSEESLATPALRTLGNLVTGNDDQTEYMIEKGVVDGFASLLRHPKKIYRKESCWGLSNLMASPPHILQKVLDYGEGQIVQTLFDMVYFEDYSVMKECIIALTNTCAGGNYLQIKYMVSEGLIDMIVDTFKNYYSDSVLILPCLDALENMLTCQQTEKVYTPMDNPFLIKMAKIGGFQAFEELQNHNDQRVYTIVSRIIDNFFQADEVERQ